MEYKYDFPTPGKPDYQKTFNPIGAVVRDSKPVVKSSIPVLAKKKPVERGPIDVGNERLSMDEFADMIKKNSPGYKNVDNTILVQKMIAKYPKYAEVVDMPEPETQIEEAPAIFKDEHADEGVIKQSLKAVPRAIGSTAMGVAEGIGKLGQGATNLLSKGYQAASNVVTGEDTPATQFENPVTALKAEFAGETQANLPTTTVAEDIAKVGAGGTSAAFNALKAPLAVGINTAAELPGTQYITQGIGAGIKKGGEAISGVTGISHEGGQDIATTAMNTLGLRAKTGDTAATIENAKGAYKQGGIVPAAKSVAADTFQATKDIAMLPAKAVRTVADIGVRAVKPVLENALPKTEGMAANLSTRFNRLDPTKITEFKKMTGETPGEFLVNRGISTAGENTVPVLAKNFQESMNEADKGFAAIDGNFKFNTPGTDYLKVAISDLRDKLVKEEDPNAGKVEGILNKYKKEGLSQTEINEVKRLYQSNNQFSYEGKFSSEAKRATNILNRIRDWQFDTAAENGFSNIAEINKNTQAYKSFLDNLSKKLGKSEGNNAMNLTDWIVLSGDAANLPAVLAKRLASTDSVKGWLLKLLSSKAVKEPIIKAKIPDILKSNLNRNVIRTSGIGGGGASVNPGLKVLPSPSKK